MTYNISPFLAILTDKIPNAEIWKNKFTSFFQNKEYDPVLQDWYYDKLIDNISEVQKTLEAGYFVDSYTGLFSFPSPHIEASHSFNLARFVNDNYQHFYNKKILTLCADFGVMNIQMKMCGLNVVSSVQKEYYNVGSVLACIGNNVPPYPINRFEFPEEDVVFLSCVFQEDELSYVNWEYMIEKKLASKEVFFTSNSYFYLRRYMNYDRIELVIDPQKMYNKEDYADISYGYMNKIYRLK